MENKQMSKIDNDKPIYWTCASREEIQTNDLDEAIEWIYRNHYIYEPDNSLSLDEFKKRKEYRLPQGMEDFAINLDDGENWGKGYYIVFADSCWIQVTNGFIPSQSHPHIIHPDVIEEFDLLGFGDSNYANNLVPSMGMSILDDVDCGIQIFFANSDVTDYDQELFGTNE